MKTWPQVKLSELLTHYQQYIENPEPRIYPKLSVKLYGRGVVLDEPADGAILKMKRHQLARAGQVILSEIWGKKGAIGFVPPEGEGALCTSHFFLFDVNLDQLEPGYLQLIFRANYLEDQLNIGARGTTGYAAVRPKHLLSATIPLPTLEEQRRIIARIEELSAKIEEARGLRSEVRNSTESLMRAAVTTIDVKLRDRYESKALEHLVLNEKGALRSGPFGSALLHEEFVTDGIPAIGIQDVQENRFVLTRRWCVTSEKADELSRFRIRPHDVLITVMGTLGRACPVPENVPHMISTKHVWSISLDRTRADEKWVSYWINFASSVREHLLGQSTGTAIPGLNGQKIKSITLPTIDLPQQHRIVAYLDALQAQIDTVKKHQEETAKELDTLMPSILSRVFSGAL